MSRERIAPDPRRGIVLIRMTGAAAAVLAAVVVWLVARYGAGMQLRTPGFTATGYPTVLTVGVVAVVAAVASLAGWGVATLIERVARRPRRAWITAALLVTAVSLSAPLSGHGITAAERLALACMHLAVAAVLVPAFAANLRPIRRSIEVPASRSGTGHDPRLPAETRR